MAGTAGKTADSGGKTPPHYGACPLGWAGIMKVPLSLKNGFAEMAGKPETYLPAFISAALETQKLLIDESVSVARAGAGCPAVSMQAGY